MRIWYLRRAIFGLSEIMENAVRTAKALVPPDDEDTTTASKFFDVQDCLHEIHLLIIKLNSELEKIVIGPE